MHSYRFDAAVDALFKMNKIAYGSGKPVSPRGQKTYELTNVQIQIDDMGNCLPIGMNRGFNSKLGAAESLQLLAGIADPTWMTAASPKYLEFTGGAMTGAYGPRLSQQMPRIIDVLRKDSESRQAVAMIWDPSKDTFQEHGDRPCTVYIQFMLRPGGLITTTHMRSQDVYLGMTYDFVMFSMLHQTVANVLGVRAASFIHNVTSLHMYDRDKPNVSKLIMAPFRPEFTLRGLKGRSWLDIQKQAIDIAYSADDKFKGVGDDMTVQWLRANSKCAREVKTSGDPAVV